VSLLFKLGKQKDALPEIEALLKTNPENKEYHTLLRQAHGLTGAQCSSFCVIS
jgi:predicted Zn-dependent protease